MKISKFTSTYSYNGETVLFNSESEGMLVLDPKLEDIYNQNISHPNKLEKIYPAFLNVLKNYRFIVPDDIDEGEELIRSWEQNDNASDHFGIIINPTLNCNLRCWYCYESHKGIQVMDEVTRKSIFRLIEEKTKEPKLKTLNISFFGGEPLLYFDENVLPVLRFAAEICKKNGIALYSNFTTNAVLLTNHVIETLNELPLYQKPTFQITLDGNREAHDKIRVGVNKKPTYNIILNHIRLALQHGNMVYVRFNYTYDNILTFNDVLEDFIHEGLNTYPNMVSIKFEHVWQDMKNLSNSRPLMKKVQEAFEMVGFNVENDDCHYRHVCYADSPHYAVINYNGDVFKCTAREFLPKVREGFLREDGHICWNEKFEKRMTVRYNNKACRQCFILPICNGGCTQNKLEANNIETCYMGLTEENKRNYLKSRIEELILKKQKLISTLSEK